MKTESQGLTSKDCIFCEIVKVSVRLLLSSHVISLGDLNEETGAHLFRITTHVAAAIRKSGLRCDGVNLLLKKEILHLHFHVFPRFGVPTDISPIFSGGH